MAYAYWKAGKADQRAVFHLYFRKQPFGGGYSICSGLEDAVDFLTNFRFAPSDLQYLESLTGSDERPLFESAFLHYLQKMQFRCDVHGIPEGTVVFPHEPLVRVSGPILQAQLVETGLLNILNFQTLIATKAARVCQAAEGDPVIEFGLRRAQGVDGALTASRAAYVGGCAGTSNLMAGQRFGIPVRGTHAHSWVMAFGSEVEAFTRYGEAMPNNNILLVDTYDTIEGVKHAIEAGKRLRSSGGTLGGIRLDSGDLAYLSIAARKLLDEAGFNDAVILASNDLDEHLIQSLKQQKAAIHVWGVGTRLVTAYDYPALGGIYKLSALERQPGTWEYKVKVSDQVEKVSDPGILQVRRYSENDKFIGDAIYDETTPLKDKVTIVDPADPTRRKQFRANDVAGEDLLVPVLREGKQVYKLPDLDSIRARVREQLEKLHPGIKRFLNPHRYPAGLESSLYELKTRLLLQTKQREAKNNTDQGIA